MADYIVIIILAALIIYSVMQIRKEKKKGSGCIGCSSSGNCSGSCNKSK